MLSDGKPCSLVELKSNASNNRVIAKSIGVSMARLELSDREAPEYRALSPGERTFVEHLLKIRPDYQHQSSGLLKLKPAPAPGLASAIAAAKMMRARWEIGVAG